MTAAPDHVVWCRLVEHAHLRARAVPDVAAYLAQAADPTGHLPRPTESQLAATGWGRNAVRRAFGSLVAAGLLTADRTTVRLSVPTAREHR